MEYIIYKYTSKSTGKTYVGRTSKSLEERAGKDGKSYSCCPYFYKAIQTQGWEDFKPSILEKVKSAREARRLEHKYILELNTVYPNGYNTVGWSINSIENSSDIEYNSDMNLDELSKSTKKQILDYYDNGMSAKDIASELQVSRSYVYQIIDKSKGKGDDTVKILMDKITVLENQLAEKTQYIIDIENDLKRKDAIIDKLLGL